MLDSAPRRVTWGAHQTQTSTATTTVEFSTSSSLSVLTAHASPAHMFGGRCSSRPTHPYTLEQSRTYLYCLVQNASPDRPTPHDSIRRPVLPNDALWLYGRIQDRLLCFALADTYFTNLPSDELRPPRVPSYRIKQPPFYALARRGPSMPRALVIRWTSLSNRNDSFSQPKHVTYDRLEPPMYSG